MSTATSLVCCGNLGNNCMILSASVSNEWPDGPARSSVLSIKIKDPLLLELYENMKKKITPSYAVNQVLFIHLSYKSHVLLATPTI